MSEQPDRTGAVIVEGTKDHQINALIEQCNRMARDLRHADAERDAAEFEIRHLQRGLDAAQTALGLASEEVRELRAEVERLKEELEDDTWAMKLRTARAEVARLTEALRAIRDDEDLEHGRTPQDVAAYVRREAAISLSPASTESVRITPSGEAVRLSPETEGR